MGVARQCFVFANAWLYGFDVYDLLFAHMLCSEAGSLRDRLVTQLFSPEPDDRVHGVNHLVRRAGVGESLLKRDLQLWVKSPGRSGIGFQPVPSNSTLYEFWSALGSSTHRSRRFPLALVYDERRLDSKTSSESSDSDVRRLNYCDLRRMHDK